jgi:hypothetical protein
MAKPQLLRNKPSPKAFAADQNEGLQDQGKSWNLSYQLRNQLIEGQISESRQNPIIPWSKTGGELSPVNSPMT